MEGVGSRWISQGVRRGCACWREDGNWPGRRKWGEAMDGGESGERERGAGAGGAERRGEGAGDRELAGARLMGKLGQGGSGRRRR